MPTRKATQREEDDRPSVMIVDDHPIVRQGLAELLRQEPDLRVCCEAEDAHQALQTLQQYRPDVVVVDISLKDSNGIELIKDIKIRFPRVQVLVLSMHDESLYAERVLRAGARGYVTKDEDPGAVLTAIRRVLAGEIYLSEKMSTKMISKLTGARLGSERISVDRLSDRELQVFEFIGQGLGTRQIAERLHLSVKTIESHRENIKRKLDLASAVELLQYAIQWTQLH